MGMNLEPLLVQGLNLCIKFLTKSVPGGKVAFAACCDAGELAGKMLVVICPKIKDESLTEAELESILAEFKADVPQGTWNVALAAVRSALDRLVGGAASLK